MRGREGIGWRGNPTRTRSRRKREREREEGGVGLEGDDGAVDVGEGAEGQDELGGELGGGGGGGGGEEEVGIGEEEDRWRW